MAGNLCFRLVLIPWLAAATLAVAADPLPSWNDGAAKRAILEFVRAATDRESPHFVPPTERVAAFDNDGTLWVEMPVYTQVVFAADRVRQLAPAHPRWNDEEPFKSILAARDNAALADFSIQDFARVVAETHAGITVAQFQRTVRDWLDRARHPRFKRAYTDLVYLPMLELMRYLRAHEFSVFIVTGGGQDFVRASADRVYGVPPERVIGSAGRTKYEYRDGRPVLVKLPEVLLVDDKKGKPEGIHLMIGRRPRAAFGNSTGDREMLEWTQAGGPPGLMMLVHHDDAKREYDYGANSKVGTFSEALMAEAIKRRWIVISMKRDWKRIFAFER